MRVFDFDSAIVRTPARSVVDGLRAGAGPSPDYPGVLAEHEAYVRALRAAGVGVTVLPPLESFPDSVFVEDPALVFTEAAILLNPGAPSRQGEARELSPTLSALFPRVLTLADGHADGGDILVTPHRVLIGLSARTDEKGAEALRRALSTLDRASDVVHVPAGTLHLKTDCSLLDEETILATEPLAGSKWLEDFLVLVVLGDERHASNAIRVNDVVLLRAGCPRTHEMLTRHGFDVVALPTNEIAKIDAGLSCMSLRWLGR